jgi:hypothetical protein
VSPSLRGLFGRRPPQLPDEVRSALGRERPLAAARAEDGTWLVGSRDRLHAVGETVRSWPWEQVLRADWDEDERRFELVPVGEFGHPVERPSFVLGDAADLLGLVRERVSASVVLQRRVPVLGKRGFLVFGRRPPRGGDVAWAFELDEGVDPDDPAVRSAMDRALAEAQGSLGLPQA